MAAPAGHVDPKQEQMAQRQVSPEDARLTTDQGIPVDDTDDSLSAGERAPSLPADFQPREKITHFDHERIPERVVHARGADAYGHFRLHDSLAEYTTAEFRTGTSLTTPVFVRFSTVAGARGSADTVRDVRGFATKFHTRQGNVDLVGDNMPVFFIQDGIEFPGFVHAVKPEPRRPASTRSGPACSTRPRSSQRGSLPGGRRRPVRRRRRGHRRGAVSGVPCRADRGGQGAPALDARQRGRAGLTAPRVPPGPRAGGGERPRRRAGPAAWPHSANYLWATSQASRYPS